MSFEDVMQVIKDLARSQGAYGRMLEAIENMDSEQLDNFRSTIEAQNFADPIDFILWIES